MVDDVMIWVDPDGTDPDAWWIAHEAHPNSQHEEGYVYYDLLEPFFPGELLDVVSGHTTTWMEVKEQHAPD